MNAKRYLFSGMHNTCIGHLWALLAIILIGCINSPSSAAVVEKKTVEVMQLMGDIYGSLNLGGGIYVCTIEAFDTVMDDGADRKVSIVRFKVNRIFVTGDGITAKEGDIVSLPMVRITIQNIDDFVPSVWPGEVLLGHQYLCVIVKNAIDTATSVRTADGAPTFIYKIVGTDDKVVKSFEAIAAIHCEKDPIVLNGLLTRAVGSDDLLLSEYAIKKAARELVAVDPLFWFRRSIGLVLQALRIAEKNETSQKAATAICFMELEQLCAFREDTREKDALIVSAVANEIVNRNEMTKRQAILTLARIIGSSTPERGRSVLYARRILTIDQIKAVLAQIGTPMTTEDTIIVGWLQS